MFRAHGSELVKGSMLALTIDAILDFAGDRRGHFRLIACEVVSHDGYGTPRELFIAFFAVIRETLRESARRRMVARTSRSAWDQLLIEIDAFAGSRSAKRFALHQRRLAAIPR